MATSDTLISDIKILAGFSDDNYWTDAEMLTILNREMKVTITPLVLKLQEEFFLQTKDYNITDGGSYRLPKRSIGNKLRDVKIIDGDDYTDLLRLYEEDRSSGRSGYYINRNSLSLSDDITTGTLRISYFLAPSSLVLEASVAEVLTIDSTTQVTVSALPSTITTSTSVDFIQGVGPYDQLALEQTISNISGTTLTFASLPDDLAVGDYICLSGQSPVAVIPEELHPVLVQAALVTCLSSKKDSASKQEAEKLEAMKKTLLEMLDPRVESNDNKIRPQGLLSRVRARR